MSDCHHGSVEPCPLCEANREIGEAWGKEAVAAALVMDLANALYEEHGGPRVSEGLHGPCVVCKLIERAREWAK